MKSPQNLLHHYLLQTLKMRLYNKDEENVSLMYFMYHDKLRGGLEIIKLLPDNADNQKIKQYAQRIELIIAKMPRMSNVQIQQAIAQINQQGIDDEQ